MGTHHHPELSLTNILFIIPLDPYEHDYETFRVLASECKEGCDANADCGCNLRSGKFKCACKRGFFGTAEKRTSGASCQREFFTVSHASKFAFGRHTESCLGAWVK